MERRAFTGTAHEICRLGRNLQEKSRFENLCRNRRRDRVACCCQEKVTAGGSPKCRNVARSHLTKIVLNDIHTPQTSFAHCRGSCMSMVRSTTMEMKELGAKSPRKYAPGIKFVEIHK